MLCLCVLCKYVNGNVYKHSVLQKKIHHKAHEFVRRLSNMHGRMRKPSACTYVHTRAIPTRVQRRSIRNIAKRKTEPESLKEKVAH